MTYFWQLYKKHWKLLTIAAVTGTLAGSVCSTLIIALIHRQLRGDHPPEPYLPLLFALFIVGYFLLSSYSEYLLLSVSQNELCNLRIAFSRRILAMPLRQIEEIGGADLMASLTNDVERVANSIRQLSTLFLSGSMVLGAGIYVAWLSWPLLLITLALLAIGVFLYRLPLYRLALLQQYWVRLRNGWDQLFRHFQALTHGTKELLIHRHRRQVFLDLCLQETCRQLRDDAIRGKTFQNLFFRVGDILYLVVLGFILFVVAPWLQIEHQVLTGYIMAGLFILAPLGSIFNFGPNFGDALLAMERLKTLGVPLDGGTVIPVGETADLAVPPDAAPLLRLEEVAYRYLHEDSDETFLLGPLSLDIHAGEITFIAGGNGSGKTTLLKLLCGLYTPESGRIYWYGREVTDDNRETYRQFFSVVFSDFYLFDTLFGVDPLSRDGTARDYLKRLHLDRKVTVTDGRLSTIALSQGQRKRLALLTAYLEDRPVYVFDEWAADQDPVFKDVFYREILPELQAQGKSLLVITHDDGWYGLADRVIKLRDGQLVEDGSTAS